MKELGRKNCITSGKQKIPTCKILGVNIAAINMEWLLGFLQSNLTNCKGNYVCVSNVHTTVFSYENPFYCSIQNGGLMALPDGAPLAFLGRKRNFKEMERIAGPSLMEEIFKVSVTREYRHYFYGSTDETLDKLKSRLVQQYPDIQIVGMHSPPFRKLTVDEDKEIVNQINETNPDFIWVGLGAPKQEIWMAEHKNALNGLMIGVGAGFDYFADNIKRAPKWMQKMCLEWMFRLFQDPKRLWKRYLKTNFKFIYLILSKR